MKIKLLDEEIESEEIHIRKNPKTSTFELFADGHVLKIEDILSIEESEYEEPEETVITFEWKDLDSFIKVKNDNNGISEKFSKHLNLFNEIIKKITMLLSSVYLSEKLLEKHKDNEAAIEKNNRILMYSLEKAKEYRTFITNRLEKCKCYEILPKTCLLMIDELEKLIQQKEIDSK